MYAVKINTSFCKLQKRTKKYCNLSCELKRNDYYYFLSMDFENNIQLKSYVQKSVNKYI